MDLNSISSHLVLLAYLITAHFIGDYYLQTRRVAMEKSKDPGVMGMHGFFLLIPFVIVAVAFFSLKVLVFALVYVVIHCFQDWFIWRSYKRKVENKGLTFEYWKDKEFYDTIGLDGWLHIMTILVLYRLFFL